MRDSGDEIHLQLGQPPGTLAGNQDQPHGHSKNAQNAKARHQIAAAQRAYRSFHRAALVLGHDLPDTAFIGVVERLKAQSALLWRTASFVRLGMVVRPLTHRCKEEFRPYLWRSSRTAKRKAK